MRSFILLLVLTFTLAGCLEKGSDTDNDHSSIGKATQREQIEAAVARKEALTATVVVNGSHFNPPPMKMKNSAARLAKRNIRFRSMVFAASRKYGIEPEMIHAIISQESHYKPHAHSTVGAMGLMQMMPATAARMGCRTPYMPQCNILGGTRYIKHIIEHTGSAHVQTIAAGYNAGEGAAKSFLTGTPTQSRRTNPLGRQTPNGVPPKWWGKGQTYDYARKVAGYYLQYKRNPEYIGKRTAQAEALSTRAHKRGLM